MCIRSECWQYTRNIISGWWFETFFIFPSVWNFIIPTDEVIFFRGVGIPPTSIPRSLSWIYGRSCELFPIGQFTMAGKANEKYVYLLNCLPYIKLQKDRNMIYHYFSRISLF